MFEGIDSIKVGTTGIGAAYVGTTLVYSGGTQPIDYSTRFFCTRSLADNNTIMLTIPSGLTTNFILSISYSTDDGANWTTVNNVNNNVVTVSVSGLSSGDTVLWKGSGTSLSYMSTNSSKFSSNAAFEVEGNPMSLIYGSNFTSASTHKQSYTFYQLLRGSKVTNAENLYFNKSLNWYVYGYMFAGCTGLTTAPTLPAETLQNGCYEKMFAGCANLNYIKCLATTKSATDCLNGWVGALTIGGAKVAANGTFVKKAGVSWSTGDSGIPSGWTVVEEP